MVEVDVDDTERRDGESESSKISLICTNSYNKITLSGPVAQHLVNSSPGNTFFEAIQNSW